MDTLFWYHGNSGKKYEIRIPEELAKALRNNTAWACIGKNTDADLCSQGGPNGNFICSGIDGHPSPHIACTCDHAVACFL
jgi:hypothetical protein